MSKDLYNTKEGGYYAIKGFEYQFLHTIIAILNQENDDCNVTIEKEQDYADEDSIVQVKHKEAAKFQPSVVTNPVIQLIEEFKTNPNKQYILQCYFKDKNKWNSGNVNIEQLKKLLGDKKYDESIMKSFIQKFTLRFEENYDKTFDRAVELIQTIKMADNTDEAVYICGLISYFLKTIVIKKVHCTSLKEIKEYIQKAKYSIFIASYINIKGIYKYIQLVKNKIVVLKNLNKENLERFCVLEWSSNSTLEDLIRAIQKLNSRILIAKKVKNGSQSPAPHIFIRNFTPEQFIELKKLLIQYNASFTDGYRFYGSECDIDYMLNQYGSIKIINDFDILKQLLSKKWSIQKELYQFYTTKPLDIDINIAKKTEVYMQSFKTIQGIFN